MAHRFSSFVIRWWQDEKTERLALEHIQTGEKQTALSMDEAVDWLTSRHCAAHGCCLALGPPEELPESAHGEGEQR